MDIYSFLNSPDIANHCRKIGHAFSPLDMAVIIAMSDNPMKEKHAAWREIIAEQQDMPIPDRNCFAAQDSLHDYLRGLIAWEEKVMADFLTPVDGVVYRPRIFWHGNYRADNGSYSAADKALAAAFSEWKEDGITEFIIERETIDDPKYCEARFDAAGKMFSICGYDYSDGRPDNLGDILIFIPVPFSKGDIVEAIGNVYLLEDLPYWSRNYEEMMASQYDDSSDMISSVYGVSDAGILYWDHGPEFHRLRRYNGKLEGPKRLLHYVSLFIQGQGERLMGIHRIRLDGSEQQTLTDAECDNYIIDEAGEWIYYLKGSRSYPKIYRIPLDGITERD